MIVRMLFCSSFKVLKLFFCFFSICVFVQQHKAKLGAGHTRTLTNTHTHTRMEREWGQCLCLWYMLYMSSWEKRMTTLILWNFHFHPLSGLFDCYYLDVCQHVTETCIRCLLQLCVISVTSIPLAQIHVQVHLPAGVAAASLHVTATLSVDVPLHLDACFHVLAVHRLYCMW